MAETIKPVQMLVVEVVADLNQKCWLPHEWRTASPQRPWAPFIKRCKINRREEASVEDTAARVAEAPWCAGVIDLRALPDRTDDQSYSKVIGSNDVPVLRAVIVYRPRPQRQG